MYQILGLVIKPGNLKLPPGCHKTGNSSVARDHFFKLLFFGKLLNWRIIYIQMCVNHNRTVSLIFTKSNTPTSQSITSWQKSSGPSHRYAPSWQLTAEMSFAFPLNFPLSWVYVLIKCDNCRRQAGYNYSHFTGMLTEPLKTYSTTPLVPALYRLPDSVYCVKNDKGSESNTHKNKHQVDWGLMPFLMRKEWTQMLFLNKDHHKRAKIKI